MAGKRKGLGADQREALARQSSDVMKRARELDEGVVSHPLTTPDPVPRPILARALRAVKIALNHRSAEEAYAAINWAIKAMAPADKVTADMALVNVPGLSLRNANALETAGILSVEDFLARSRASLLLIENFGRKSIEEVERVLKEAGFTRPFTASTLISDLPGMDARLAMRLEFASIYSAGDLLRLGRKQWFEIEDIRPEQVDRIERVMIAAGLITAQETSKV